MSRFGLISRMCIAFLVICAAVLGGCAISSGSTTSTGGNGGGTPGPGTPTVGGNGGGGNNPTPVPPKVCVNKPTAFGFAFADGPNMAGNIPGPTSAPLPLPTTLSNFVYPLGIPDENAVGNAPSLTFSAFSPNATHLAVAVQQDVPFTEEYDPFVVDTGSHAVTKVPLPSPIKVANSDRIPRMFAWSDNNTLLIFANPALNGTPAGPSYSYNITTHALSNLPITKGAVEGVVRCGTLFYLTIGSFSTLSDPNHTQIAGTYINRFDLASSAAIGAPIKIGIASTWAGAEGNVDYAGWDVSQDSTRLAYQSENVTGGPTISSIFHASNADGSGAIVILPKVTSNQGTRMAVSPDGTKVAVTEAQPAPDVASGTMAGGAPTFYTTLGFAQPAWFSNSSGFMAGGDPSGSPLQIFLFSPCGGSCPGTPVIAKAYFPTTLD